MLISMMEKGCKVGFFGLGLSSAALLECLPLKKCRVTLRSDSDINWSAIPCGAKIERIFVGKSAYEDIDEDIIVFSPSVKRERPELLAAQSRGSIFTSDAELFFASNDRPVFAVTGSDGKSTTSAITHLLLEAGRVNSKLIGNIGKPLLPEINTADCFVCELSSFMLTYLTPKSIRGTITNITPNHLDWHICFEEYKKTKISLAKNCENLVITDGLSEIKGAFGIVSIERDFASLCRFYDAEIYMTLEDGYILRNGKKIVGVNEIKRNERHNLINAMIAISMTDGYVGDCEIREVLRRFGGLAHRCEKIFTENGIDFYDSSIDSTPVRTAMTLESLGRSVTIILGGKSKGLDFSNLLPNLKKYARQVVITGENAQEIYSAIGKETDAFIIPSFEEAIKEGKRLAKETGALLLSPASTSYDSFRNYAERGERFKAIITKKD